MNLDFVCIGAQKAGTTTLHDILCTHPDIYLPPRKEAQFFDVNERYEKGLNWYFETFFNTYQEEKFIGNINPNLQLNSRSLDRLKDCFGEKLKVIFIMRDPVKRAFSHYLMSVRRGYEKLSFLDALEAENKRLKECQIHTNYISNELGHYETNHFGYVFRSKYSETIKSLFLNFPKENIHLVLFEDLMKEKNVQIDKLLSFLSIPNSNHMELDKQSNVASEPKSRILRDLIYQPGILKNSLGKIFPKQKRDYLKKSLEKLNSKPLDKSHSNLDPALYSDVFEKYFQEEIKELEELTALNLKCWKC